MHHQTATAERPITVRVTPKELVEVAVVHNCGCGFRTSTLLDAVKHVHATGHQMETRGMLKREVTR